MENSSIFIRKANLNDIAGIMTVECLSFPDSVIESQKVFEDRISLFSDGFLVALFENKIIGYISSELWRFSENVPLSNFTLNHPIFETHHGDGEELYISSIAVDPKFRGSGIGKHLFEELLKNVPEKYNLLSLILLVSSNWERAFSMYQKKGFIEINRIPDFFSLGEDGIIMRNQLKTDE